MKNIKNANLSLTRISAACYVFTFFLLLYNVQFALQDKNFFSSSLQNDYKKDNNNFVFETSSEKTISVKDFGAKGDGVTNDYKAMVDAAKYLSAHPGTTLIYPPGVYHISVYKIKNGSEKNDIDDIYYDSCNNVTIIGTNAKIDVTGGFNRAADYLHTRNGHYYSYTQGVTPFFFRNSKNFKVEGFEMTGNVQNTTRDNSKVAMSGDGGIFTINCSYYTLSNLNIHHFQTDGILLGAGVIADKNVIIDSVNLHNNARNNLSIIQVRGIVVKNSFFRNAGRTEGAYGGHSPQAGVDVEPDRIMPKVDVNTGDVIFDNDVFENNVGMQIVAGNNKGNINNISIKNSKFIATASDAYMMAYAVYADGLIEGNTFTFSKGHYLTLSYKPLNYIQNLTFKDNIFNLGYNGGVSCGFSYGNKNISFIHNTFNINAQEPDKSFLNLQNLKEVSLNTFKIDASGFYSNTNLCRVILYNGTKAINGNMYETTLTGKNKYQVAYQKNGVIKNEIFTNKAHFDSSSVAY